MRQSQRTPGQRAGLTVESIVAEAKRLLAGEGPEALTMRALADRLAVAPNALYPHIGSKSALVDLVLDDVLAEVDEPARDIDDANVGLEQLMTSTYDVLVAHPELVPLYVARQGAQGPNAHRLGDAMLVLLDRGGVRGAAALEARRILIIYTIGVAAFASNPPLERGEAPKLAHDEMRATFASGLRWLLAGIGATRRRRRP